MGMRPAAETWCLLCQWKNRCSGLCYSLSGASFWVFVFLSTILTCQLSSVAGDGHDGTRHSHLQGLIRSLSASLSLPSHAVWVPPPKKNNNLYVSLSMLRKSSPSVNQLADKQRLERVARVTCALW